MRVENIDMEIDEDELITSPKKAKAIERAKKIIEENKKYTWVNVDDTLQKEFNDFAETFMDVMSNRPSPLKPYRYFFLLILTCAICIQITKSANIIALDLLEDGKFFLMNVHLAISKLIPVISVDLLLFKFYAQNRQYVVGSEIDLIQFQPQQYYALHTLTEASSNGDPFTLTPQVEMLKDAPHKIRNIRLTVAPRDPISNLLCWMIPVSVNTIESIQSTKISKYPYAYCVAVFKGTLKSLSDIKLDISKCVRQVGTSFRSSVSKEDGNTVIVIQLQGNAYYTDDTSLKELHTILVNMYPVLEKYGNIIAGTAALDEKS